ncbi:hypothetical protein V6N13_106501 [Hibiscus sabdariffa]
MLKLIINGRTQLVEYESLPAICFSCGKYGHVHDNCLLQHASTNSTDPPVAPQLEQPKPYGLSSFGPWMVFERKQRRGPKKQVDVAVNSSVPPVVASRFSPIFEEAATEQLTLADIFTRSPDTHAAAKGKTVVSMTAKVTKPKSATVIPHKSLDSVNHSAVSISENDNPNFLNPPIHLGPTKSIMQSASMEHDKEHQALPPDKRGGIPSSKPNLFSRDIAPQPEQGFGEIPSDCPTIAVDLDVTPNAEAIF